MRPFLGKALLQGKIIGPGVPWSSTPIGHFCRNTAINSASRCCCPPAIDNYLLLLYRGTTARGVPQQHEQQQPQRQLRSKAAKLHGTSQLKEKRRHHNWTLPLARPSALVAWPTSWMCDRPALCADRRSTRSSSSSRAIFSAGRRSKPISVIRSRHLVLRLSERCAARRIRVWWQHLQAGQIPSLSA